MFEKFLKRFKVGGSTLTIGGFIVIEDDHGKTIQQSCGSQWVPWEHEGRVIEMLNVISIEGEPGPGVSIKIFETSLRERKVLKELKPGFTNPDKKLQIWKYTVPITVFINGKMKKESWTISHWKMFSGRVVFDLAKNGIRCELEKPADADTNTNNAPGSKPSSPFDVLDNKDEMSQEEKDAIAGQQRDHGQGKNGGTPPEKKPLTKGGQADGHSSIQEWPFFYLNFSQIVV